MNHIISYDYFIHAYEDEDESKYDGCLVLYDIAHLQCVQMICCCGGGILFVGEIYDKDG